MTRTNLASAPVHATEVARPCALGGGYAWHFATAQVNVIPMDIPATARRLRRQPT